MIRAFVHVYVNGAGIYGLWAFILLGFRESCIFAECTPLPNFESTSLNVILSLLPDQSLYAILFAVFRAIFWLPNLLIAIATDELAFLDWLLLKNVPSMAVAYDMFDALMP